MEHQLENCTELGALCPQATVGGVLHLVSVAVCIVYLGVVQACTYCCCLEAAGFYLHTQRFPLPREVPREVPLFGGLCVSMGVLWGHEGFIP